MAKTKIDLSGLELLNEDIRKVLLVNMCEVYIKGIGAVENLLNVCCYKCYNRKFYDLLNEKYKMEQKLLEM